MKYSIKSKSRLLSLILVLTFFVGIISIPCQESIAASKKATLDRTSYTMSCGFLKPDMGIYQTNQKYRINVNDANKKATYTFSSSNTKVLKVKASGTKCNLIGIKPGKATITCSQELNGIKTQVGTCKVTVVKASIIVNYDKLCMGTDLIYFDNSSNSVCEILYRNTNATYTYHTNSKNLTMTEVKQYLSSDEETYIYAQKYTAKKAGTYTVTVKETVGRTTKKIGSFKVTVMEPEFAKKLKLSTGQYFAGDYIVQYPMNNDYNYYSMQGDGFDLLDDDAVIAYKINESGDYSLCANKEGRVKINILESESGKKITDITFIVKDN